jgi:hypothetical protein
MQSTTQQEIIERAARLLRIVATGGSTSSVYFWNITHAVEALRDGNPTEARISLQSAMDMEVSGKVQS